MPPGQHEVTLRAATPEDRFRIRRWLAEPEVEAAWGNAGSAEAEINLAMSSEAALCRIIECEGAAIGYAHAMDIGLLGDERPGELAAGTWHVNLLIASQQHRGRGLESMVLAGLAEEVFATALAVACSGVASIRNEVAVRAYERAGFRWRWISHDRLLGPSWLMLKERPV
jgi:RimJ/RimL family protein N-acetyltransferase